MSDINHHRGQTPEKVRATQELRATRSGATTPRPGKRRSDARGARNGARASLRKLV